MNYNQSLKYAAQCFLSMIKKYPTVEPLVIAEIVCKQYGVDRLEMDENAAPAETMTSPVEDDQNPAFDQYTLDELEELLQKAVEQEDYEKASMIRDEISKRKKK